MGCCLGELTASLKLLLFDKKLRQQFSQQARKDMANVSWLAATEKLSEYYELAMTIHKRYDPPSYY